MEEDLKEQQDIRKAELDAREREVSLAGRHYYDEAKEDQNLLNEGSKEHENRAKPSEATIALLSALT